MLICLGCGDVATCGHEVRGGHEVDSMERSLDPTFRSKWPWDAVAMVDPKGPQGGMQEFFLMFNAET